MSNETAITLIAPRTFDEAKTMSSTLARAQLLPAALRGKEADVLFTVMAGAELGLGPLQAIRSIHVIEGKPTLSADLIAALCLRHPDVCEYLQPVETSATKATYEAKRRGAPKPVTMSFTIEEAKAAQLLGKGNWAKYPAAMLRARCISAICRAVFPDLVGGLYDSDSGEIEERHASSASVIDSVAAPRSTPPAAAAPAPADWSPEGAPLTESAKLEVAIGAAQNEAELNALVERLGKLPKQSDAYQRLRKMWGERRDAMKKSTPAPAAAGAAPVEDVPWQTNPPESETQREPGAEG